MSEKLSTDEIPTKSELSSIIKTISQEIESDTGASIGLSQVKPSARHQTSFECDLTINGNIGHKFTVTFWPYDLATSVRVIDGDYIFPGWPVQQKKYIHETLKQRIIQYAVARSKTLPEGLLTETRKAILQVFDNGLSVEAIQEANPNKLHLQLEATPNKWLELYFLANGQILKSIPDLVFDRPPYLTKLLQQDYSLSYPERDMLRLSTLELARIYAIQSLSSIGYELYGQGRMTETKELRKKIKIIGKGLPQELSFPSHWRFISH